MGISHQQTTAYHPQSNGMVERLHRTLKDRLMSRASSCSSGTSQWMSHLPFVLLGLRTSIRQDSDCSPSDMLYGGPLRLPGDFVAPVVGDSPLPASEFAGILRSAMSAARPLPVVSHGMAPSRTDPALLSATHVFLRVDAVRKPLVPPYEGPFPVLESSQKTFVILKRGKPLTVTVDRLKPAVLLPEATSEFLPRPAPLPSAGPRPRPRWP